MWRICVVEERQQLPDKGRSGIRELLARLLISPIRDGSTSSCMPSTAESRDSQHDRPRPCLAETKLATESVWRKRR